jgi:hypothetical protein
MPTLLFVDNYLCVKMPCKERFCINVCIYKLVIMSRMNCSILRILFDDKSLHNLELVVM